MQAICLDLGTSGIRGQLLDLERRSVIRTCMTSRNPIPGANVMDHLSFAIENGQELAHEVLVSCVGQVIKALAPSRLERVSVCGNPIQLSLFEGIEIRDLAYAGENMLRSQGVRPPAREGKVIRTDEVGLDLSADLVIPPAVKHEIGADAMAMMLKSGFLEDDRCMVTDYGTNAEMALKVGTISTPAPPRPAPRWRASRSLRACSPPPGPSAILSGARRDGGRRSWTSGWTPRTGDS